LLLGGIGLLVVLWVLPLPPYVVSRDTLQQPSLAHWLGTNDLGQDVALGLAHAAPTTLVLALSAAAMALVVAVLSAYAAALYGGWVDQLVLRVVDGLQIVPSMLLALLVAAWMSPGFWGLVVLLGGLIAYDDVRVLRAVLLRELSRENVRTARILGGSSWYVLRRHVVPAIAPVLTVVYLQSTRQAVMKGAGLAFWG
jgi:peptide/nickel transport system permease protein